MFVKIIYKLFKRIYRSILVPFDYVITIFSLYANGVRFSSVKTTGIPKISVALGGNFELGREFKMNNREYANPIGRFSRCSFVVGPNAYLKIGDDVGMSSVAIVCQNSLMIGNHVKIGGNVVIYDTDFHSLQSQHRKLIDDDRSNTITKPVIIGDNVFIGAHTTILKGVTIGNNSIVGACSVVTKSIPENQIWAGNPAKYIKDVII
jgi:acetyltransferase-like isoleucine patch superfamily enzyme